jgi:Fe-S cluster biosynthesis and repair protein YggX
MTEDANQTNPTEQGPRMVQCVKLGRMLPGLEKPPFPGELGEKIFEHVSQPAWDMWLEHQVLLINHYGLNLADPAARAFLMEQLEEFFFGEDAQMPEGWTPAKAPGVGQKGGGPQRKL